MNVSGWASSVATASAAVAASGTDLGAIGQRIGTSAGDYAKAGRLYAETDEGGAAEFGGPLD